MKVFFISKILNQCSIQKLQVFGVRAIAHSVEFGKVALLSDNIGFEPLKLYEGYVTRF